MTRTPRRRRRVADSGTDGAMRELMQRCSAVVVGSGLGRSAAALEAATAIIRHAAAGAGDAPTAAAAPLIIDGDGLFLLSRAPELVRGCRRAVLTLNAMEFKRLWDAVMVPPGAPAFDMEAWTQRPADHTDVTHAQRLADACVPGAAWLGTLRAAWLTPPGTLPQAGQRGGGAEGQGGRHFGRRAQCVLSGRGSARRPYLTRRPPRPPALTCATPGAPRRCGGQGDVLAGLTALYASWVCSAGLGAQGPADAEVAALQQSAPLVAAAAAACHLTRSCARAAFAAQGRAMTAPDLLAALPGVLRSEVGE